MNAIIAIDGPGLVEIQLLKGEFTGIHFKCNPHTLIRITRATKTWLIAGECTQNWFRVDVDTAAERTFLQVRIKAQNNTCHFIPDGYPAATAARNQEIFGQWSDDCGFELLSQYVFPQEFSPKVES